MLWEDQRVQKKLHKNAGVGVYNSLINSLINSRWLIVTKCPSDWFQNYRLSVEMST